MEATSGPAGGRSERGGELGSAVLARHKVNNFKCCGRPQSQPMRDSAALLRVQDKDARSVLQQWPGCNPWQYQARAERACMLHLQICMHGVHRDFICATLFVA